jgi:hypothetical protein
MDYFNFDHARLPIGQLSSLHFSYQISQYIGTATIPFFRSKMSEEKLIDLWGGQDLA